MYSKVLQRVIAETNITQEELSKKCKELNAPISRGQINAILNNRALAPSEEVSRAISKICNVDDRELVIEGYLEKSPKEFIEFMNKFQELTFNLSFSQLKNTFPKNIMDIYFEEYKKQTYSKLIIGILDIKDNIYTDNNIFQITNTENRFNINLDVPYITLDDNSMEPKIPKDSKLKLTISDKYKNGDILLIEYNKIKYVRIAIFIGRNIFLYPLNKNYNSFYLNDTDCNILAKVDSIEIKL